MSENKIINILIAKGTKPLVSYSDHTGDFVQICESMLSKVEKDQSAAINLETGYSIFYINENDITFLVMANSLFPKATAVGCIESVKKEFQIAFLGRDFESENNYGLNEDFQEKLKMKYEFYNENIEVSNEVLANLKKAMEQMKDEILEASGLLEERTGIIQTINERADSLIKSSEGMKRSTKHVKNKESKKKLYICIAIILAVLIILYLLICMFCGSLTFQCS